MPGPGSRQTLPTPSSSTGDVIALISFTTPTLPAGSTAGITMYRHGPSQFCARSRSRPTKVSSNANRLATSSIATLSMLWELLTNSQRAGWGAYAFATPLLDAYSSPRYIKGYAHYMRSNRPRLLWQLPLVSDPPTTPGLPPYTPPTTAYYTPRAQLQLAWPNTDDWSTEDGSYMFLWLSHPTPTPRTRPPETYSQFAYMTGDSTRLLGAATFTVPTPPATPRTQLWVRTAVSRADGRYTSQ